MLGLLTQVGNLAYPERTWVAQEKAQLEEPEARKQGVEVETRKQQARIQ